MAQNWMVNPKTGDYEMENGAPLQTDSLVVPAYYRLKIARDGWMYAPDRNYGSTFNQIKKNPSGGDTTKIENTGSVALQPILDDGRAISITVETILAARNSVGLDIVIQRQRGVFDQLEIPALPLMKHLGG